MTLPPDEAPAIQSPEMSAMRGPQPGELIQGVSIRWPGGAKTMGSPARHHTLMEAMRKEGLDTRTIGPNDQGFCTTHRRFVHRDEAMLIAKAAGQILKEPTFQPNTLFSEDVW